MLKARQGLRSREIDFSVTRDLIGLVAEAGYEGFVFEEVR